MVACFALLCLWLMTRVLPDKAVAASGGSTLSPRAALAQTLYLSTYLGPHPCSPFIHRDRRDGICQRT